MGAVAVRDDVAIGTRCRLNPETYPAEPRDHRVVHVRKARTYLGGYAVGVQPLTGAPYAKPHEYALAHLMVDARSAPELPDWRRLDIGGRSRNRNGEVFVP